MTDKSLVAGGLDTNRGRSRLLTSDPAFIAMAQRVLSPWARILMCPRLRYADFRARSHSWTVGFDGTLATIRCAVPGTDRTPPPTLFCPVFPASMMGHAPTLIGAVPEPGVLQLSASVARRPGVIRWMTAPYLRR